MPSVFEVGEPPLELVLLLLGVLLPEVEVGPPVRRVEAPVAGPDTGFSISQRTRGGGKRSFHACRAQERNAARPRTASG